MTTHRKTSTMKRYLILLPALFLFSLFYTITLFAQAPDAIVYQAQARDLDGKVLTVKTIEVKITILQGSPTVGTIVWEAIHEIQTDKYGLFTLTIGEGTSVGYDFSAIDWGNYSHFLNVKFDKNGTWIDLGTTQFLSVPYALHAGTAERAIIDNVDDDDPDPTNELNTSVNLNGTNLEVSDAGGTIIQDLSSLVDDADSDPTNELQDLSDYALKSNVLELDNTSEFSPGADYEPATKKYVDDAVYAGHYVGENYGGGIVFWVDETGEHGLIASTEDLGSFKWETNSPYYPFRDGIGAGMFNAQFAIIEWVFTGWEHEIVQNALSICAFYNGGGYGDWYLPSKYELNLLYSQKEALGMENTIPDPFGLHVYWSSTHILHSNINEIWVQDFTTGNQYSDGFFAPDLGPQLHNVRAVRAF